MAWLVLVLGLSLRMMAAPPMSAAEVGALEDQVAADAEDLDARGRLLEYYFLAGDVGEWGRHELWLVEHHPESDLHRAPVGMKAPEGAALIEKLSVAWRKALEDQAAPVDAVRNAAVFFAGVDAGESVALLRRARAAAQFDGRVLQLLVDAYVSNHAGERALDELENGQDAELMWMVGRGLVDRPRGERLMAKAKEMDPEVAEKAERTRRVVTGAGGRQPRLVQRVEPVYPEVAKEKRVEGVVRLSVVISRTGEVLQLTLVSGHPLLVQAAVDAVKQWRYQPTMVDGAAAEVMTEAGVVFKLPQ